MYEDLLADLDNVDVYSELNNCSEDSFDFSDSYTLEEEEDFYSEDDSYYF